MLNDDTATSRPVVSVIIPAYNRPEMVLRAITSVQRQTLDDLEIIVVDDGSTDDTADAIASVPDDRVRLLRHETNRGASATRKTGLEAARGRFVAFLDSDDLWHPSKLAMQVEHAGSRSKPFISYTRTRIIRGAKVDVVPGRAIGRDECVLEYILRDGFIQTSALFGRREVCVDVSFNEESGVWDDWDFLLRAQAAGVQLEMIDEPLVDHVAGSHARVTNSGPPAGHPRRWLSDHQELMTEAAARSFTASCVALDDARHGHPLSGTFAALRGWLRGDVRWRTAAGVVKAALDPRR